LDVGTGWGFPLLPLAIEYPALQCFWLDATQKKCRAVQSIADHLYLSNVKLIRGRAEEVQGQYDLVTSRGVAFAEKLFSRTIKFAKSWWYIVWWKMWTQEEDTYITKYHSKWKTTLEAKYRYQLTDDDIERVLYVMKKN
jgi:16S rRNA (guanine527-N7)-methyltransferase